MATGQRLANIERFGLWESPCGLAFFEPMLEGDEAFYRELCLGAVIQGICLRVGTIFYACAFEGDTGKLMVD